MAKVKTCTGFTKLFTYLCPLYITIPKAYTPKGSREKNYFIATKKRNLLLSKRAATLKYLNEEVST